jgi:hypothetical protein
MITIYPNPVMAGNAINIGCERMKEGYYLLCLLNPLGRQMEALQVWIDGDALLMDLRIPPVSAGNYSLTLTNKISGQSFIQAISIVNKL